MLAIDVKHKHFMSINIVYIVEIKMFEMCGLIESTKDYYYQPLIFEKIKLEMVALDSF